jgi:hypothetical protein
MAKVVLINLQNFSYNEIEISLENDLLPVFPASFISTFWQSKK